MKRFSNPKVEIELNDDDMQRDPLEVRKATVRNMLAKAGVASGFRVRGLPDNPNHTIETLGVGCRITRTRCQRWRSPISAPAFCESFAGGVSAPIWDGKRAVLLCRRSYYNPG
jgi:hypothetical protein